MIYILIFIIIFFLYILITNDIVVVSRYFISSKKIPKDFDNYKILQISDFHSNYRLINKTVEKIKREKPNIIVITGDLIDRYESFDNIKKFLNMIKDIAPIYYVSGNHEIYYKRFIKLKKILAKLNIKVLENKSVSLKLKNNINLIGINDISYNKKNIEKVIKSLIKENEYNILLSHRPEIFEKYGQGIFPKYTSGVYEKNETKMIVNRALGDSGIVIRINNMRDIVLVTLKSEK